jgi:hypothetical protein
MVPLSKGFPMRILFAASAMLLAPAAAFAAETVVMPDTPTPAMLTVEQPDNPKGSTPEAPVLQSISARVNVRLPNGETVDIVPDFHFIAPKGNAVVLHRELVETSRAGLGINPVAPIAISAEAQKQGAVVSGGWRCRVGQYYVRLKAYIIDTDGGHSNTVQYTIHCNGG